MSTKSTGETCSNKTEWLKKFCESDFILKEVHSRYIDECKAPSMFEVHSMLHFFGTFCCGFRRMASLADGKMSENLNKVAELYDNRLDAYECLLKRVGVAYGRRGSHVKAFGLGSIETKAFFGIGEF